MGGLQPLSLRRSGGHLLELGVPVQASQVTNGALQPFPALRMTGTRVMSQKSLVVEKRGGHSVSPDCQNVAGLPSSGTGSTARMFSESDRSCILATG